MSQQYLARIIIITIIFKNQLFVTHYGDFITDQCIMIYFRKHFSTWLQE
jgi:hypothetical protein